MSSSLHPSLPLSMYDIWSVGMKWNHSNKKKRNDTSKVNVINSYNVFAYVLNFKRALVRLYKILTSPLIIILLSIRWFNLNKVLERARGKATYPYVNLTVANLTMLKLQEYILEFASFNYLYVLCVDIILWSKLQCLRSFI